MMDTKQLQFLFFILSLLLLNGVITAQVIEVNEKGKRYVIVRHGNTAKELAQKFGFSLRDMADINSHIKDIDNIYPGDTLFLPKSIYEGGVPEDSKNINEQLGTEVYPPVNTHGDNRIKNTHNTNLATDINFKGGRYRVSIFDPDKVNFWLVNRLTKHSRKVHTLRSVVEMADYHRFELLFAMNAGMFNPSFEPVGLFINDFQNEPVNIKEQGYGNFYSLPPNGVFMIDNQGQPRLYTTKEYLQNRFRASDIALATQSGPMLVSRGNMNEAFNLGSQNRKIRNGVGIDRDGNVVMIISHTPVNFYDFTQLFMMKYNCDNALCLDGVISKSYTPRLDDPRILYDQTYPLGTIIAVVKK